MRSVGILSSARRVTGCVGTRDKDRLVSARRNERRRCLLLHVVIRPYGPRGGSSKIVAFSSCGFLTASEATMP